MKSTITLLLVCLSAALVRAQTQTVVDLAGETVVEVITVNPIQGLPSTRTIQTLNADDETTLTTSTSSTTTSTGTTTTLNQGPVAQPAPTLTGQTTYQYTTTDALGDTTVIDDTFTPSSITATVTPELSLTGTVLDYSSWLGMVGTNTAAAIGAASSGTRLLSRKAYTAGAALLSGAVGGAWFVLI